MGFFKDFKDDLSDAVDEMLPGGKTDEDPGNDDVVGNIDDNIDVNSELSKLDGLLEQVARKVDEPAPAAAPAPAPARKIPEPVKPAPRPEMKAPNLFRGREDNRKEDRKMSDSIDDIVRSSVNAPTPASDENAVITTGMTITGNLDSTGSIEVNGVINGDVQCNGKLTVTGFVNGNSSSSEFYADNARITGDISTSGTVKIGVGSVIIGNISANSAVIAGAVKGDIDVQGPVVVDTSAVVMGNIKSRSVQINNGAVIEGFCSQAYAEVDTASVFAINS